MDSRAQAVLRELVHSTWKNMGDEDRASLMGDRSAEIFSEIIRKSRAKTRRLLFWQRIAIAASLLLALISATYFFYRSGLVTSPQRQVSQMEIAPGTNRATLTLDDGRMIDLSEAHEGIVVGDEITYIDGSKVLSEQGTDSQAHSLTRSLQLTTPKGGTYQVTLSDGTKVWLNAASTIKYPANFSAVKERYVALSGEAYFEVAKDQARPFIVRITSPVNGNIGQQVEVLGTHFNISAYDDVRTVKTTLLEGSVKVSALPATDSRLLAAGQQSSFDGQAIQVSEVDTEDAIAWKNGYFQFSGKTLELAMQEVARWYNVEVSYKNEALRKQPLAGTISKYGKLSTVLETMELTGAIRFRVDGRIVVVE